MFMKNDAELLRNIYIKMVKRGQSVRLTKAEKEVIKKYDIYYFKSYGMSPSIDLKYDLNKEANWCCFHEIHVPVEKIDKINLAEMIVKKRQRNLADSYVLPGCDIICDIRDSYFNTGINASEWKHGWPTFQDSKTKAINSIYESRFGEFQNIIYRNEERFKNMSKARKQSVLRKEFNKITQIISCMK